MTVSWPDSPSRSTSFGDREVGVAGPQFGRFDAEQLGVEGDRGFQVTDTQSQLHTGHEVLPIVGAAHPLSG
jgi:hypothetical protein